MNTLAHQIRKHLPPGYSVSAHRSANGHVHVHVAYRQGAYNLTLGATGPIDGPDDISPENIAANAVRMLGGGTA